MKKLIRTKPFLKAYQKRILPRRKLDKQFEERLELFLSGERDYPLYNHPLTGTMSGMRAFSIANDIRVVYRETDDAYEFIDIGSHNQVYK
jgi:addiction module RelE/StbE family toxin